MALSSSTIICCQHGHRVIYSITRQTRENENTFLQVIRKVAIDVVDEKMQFMQLKAAWSVVDPEGGSKETSKIMDNIEVDPIQQEIEGPLIFLFIAPLSLTFYCLMFVGSLRQSV